MERVVLFDKQRDWGGGLNVVASQSVRERGHGQNLKSEVPKWQSLCGGI